MSLWVFTEGYYCLLKALVDPNLQLLLHQLQYKGIVTFSMKPTIRNIL